MKDIVIVAVVAMLAALMAGCLSEPAHEVRYVQINLWNARLRSLAADLRKLYEAAESNLFKLRYASYATPPNGLQEPSERRRA